MLTKIEKQCVKLASLIVQRMDDDALRQYVYNDLLDKITPDNVDDYLFDYQVPAKELDNVT